MTVKVVSVDRIDVVVVEVTVLSTGVTVLAVKFVGKYNVVMFVVVVVVVAVVIVVVVVS